MISLYVSVTFALLTPAFLVCSPSGSRSPSASFSREIAFSSASSPLQFGRAPHNRPASHAVSSSRKSVSFVENDDDAPLRRTSSLNSSGLRDPTHTTAPFGTSIAPELHDEYALGSNTLDTVTAGTHLNPVKVQLFQRYFKHTSGSPPHPSSEEQDEKIESKFQPHRGVDVFSPVDETHLQTRNAPAREYGERSMVASGLFGHETRSAGVFSGSDSHLVSDEMVIVLHFFNAFVFECHLCLPFSVSHISSVFRCLRVALFRTPNLPLEGNQHRPSFQRQLLTSGCWTIQFDYLCSFVEYMLIYHNRLSFLSMTYPSTTLKHLQGKMPCSKDCL